MAGLCLAPLFGALPEARLKTLAQACRLKTYSHGEVLGHAGDALETLWLVLGMGLIKLSRETADGTEAVWDVLGQGEIVGLETAVAKTPTAPTTAVAVGPVEVICIPHEAFSSLLEDGAFARAMLEHLSDQTNRQRLETEHRAHQTTAQRLGCFLLRLAHTPEEGEATVRFPFDKGLLAARLGMDPATFSRALGKLKADTGLSVSGLSVTIPDIRRLTAYTCGSCSGTYPCLTDGPGA
jgi:CRP-like cAMP-binding protein